MSSTIPKALAPLLSVQRLIIHPIFALSTMYFTYGIYVLLFGTYLYLMRSREKRSSGTANASKLYFGLTVALFVLCTTYVVVYTIFHVSDTIVYFGVLSTGDASPLSEYFSARDNTDRLAVYELDNLVPVILNITADWMLIHRCYAIWSYNKWVGVPLVVVSILVNATGVANRIMVVVGLVYELKETVNQGGSVDLGYNIGTIIFNSILTLLTGMSFSFYRSLLMLMAYVAGRIWWIHRQVRAHGSQTSDRFVQTVYRIILESGILYPFFQITGLILHNVSDVVSVPYDFYPVTTLSAGIAPTLIMVRAKLGKNVESLQESQAVSDMRFNDGPVATTGGAVDIALTDNGSSTREEGKVSV